MTRSQYIEKYLEVHSVWETLPQWLRDWSIVRLREMELEIDDERCECGNYKLDETEFCEDCI